MLEKTYNLVTYGKHRIAKAGEKWNVAHWNNERNTLFGGTYNECIEFCEKLYGKTVLVTYGRRR